jgi:uncharacterized small protein (DUF1192 family)
MSGKSGNRFSDQDLRKIQPTGRVTTAAEAAIFRTSPRRRAMPAIDDDDRPKKKIVHEIGQDLALISVKELQERIALLKAEITRLEADINRKEASRNVADQFFKK